MIDKEYIEKIVNEVTEGTHIFLTKLVVDTHGRIKIFIDGDSNVTIDVHISKLREKLGADLIQTIKGVGYKINP
jgi:DNA-binding response OmpR family regulator